MGALGRILRLGWFAGLAGASVVAQACGGATSGRRLPPGAGGADGATGGASGTGGANSGAGGDTVGSGGATGGTTPLDAGPP
ncbi:MAG TPA: hypothetical protein PLU22_25520, partial [Polyangiaceae bacterium]|nr:hypothetical protein [Polyangiaceae bacterium]